MKRLLACTTTLFLATAVAAATHHYEREVTPLGAGPAALRVDMPLLAGAQPGLPDLRLYDAGGIEVPYLLIEPPDAATRTWVGGKILLIQPTRTESGFEVDLHAAMDRDAGAVDRLRLTGLGTPFLKRFQLEASGDRQRWVMLMAQGTLFDLPEQSLRMTEVSIEPPDAYRYLRITWDDRSSARGGLPATAEARLASRPAPAPALRAEVSFTRRPSEPSKSRFTIRLPAAGLPVVALVMEGGSGNLFRAARVTEGRFARGRVEPTPLGDGLLRRSQVEDLVAQDLRIPIESPKGTDVELVIDDGDNPPFEPSRVEIDLAPQPWIFFESTDGSSLVARFGDARLESPRYDIEVLRTAVGKLGAREATWGERRNAVPAAEQPASASTGMPARGARVDLSRFTYQRRIPPGESGLVALPLDAGVLAHDHDMRDVRIADAQALQVPYLIERRDEPLSLELPPLASLPPDAARPSVSHYSLALPTAGLPSSRLVLETTAHVFERTVSVVADEPPPDPRSRPRTRTLATSQWMHASEDEAAPALVLELPETDHADLRVEIDEGDNSPLPLSSPRLLLPSYRLRFFRGAGDELLLTYGYAESASPRYDLELLARELLFAPVTEVTVEPEPAVAADPRPARDRKLFWGVLIVAVVALVALLRRVIRPEGAPPAA